MSAQNHQTQAVRRERDAAAARSVEFASIVERDSELLVPCHGIEQQDESTEAVGGKRRPVGTEGERLGRPWQRQGFNPRLARGEIEDDDLADLLVLMADGDERRCRCQRRLTQRPPERQFGSRREA